MTIKEYTWPVPEEFLKGFSILESPVHREVLKFLNACDFIVPLNTPVLAMEEGKVTYVKQDSQQGGNDLPGITKIENSKFWNLGNRIEINHQENEYSGYEHLAYNSCLVKKGDLVKKGQQIARTGYTGLMAHLGPHLHVERFHWFGPGNEDFTTIQIHWENENILFSKYLWDSKKWKKQ